MIRRKIKGILQLREIGDTQPREVPNFGCQRGDTISGIKAKLNFPFCRLVSLRGLGQILLGEDSIQGKDAILVHQCTYTPFGELEDVSPIEKLLIFIDVILSALWAIYFYGCPAGDN